MEEAKITFYDIIKCGLYEYGGEDSVLGGLADFLNQLKTWALEEGKSLDQTCTYEPENGEGTFCYDIVSSPISGDFLLTTWNQTPSYEGTVAAVPAKSRVGSARVEFTPLPEDTIPGYATYFWFLPEYSVFATIQFQRRMNGKQNLDNYFKGFIALFSDYCVQVDEDSLDIKGYSEIGSEEILNLYPMYKANIHRKPGAFEIIRNQRLHIKKVIRHSTLTPGLDDARNWWEKSLGFIGLTNKPPLNADIDVAFEFEFKPSEDELNTMIDTWRESHEAKWDDIGFKIAGHSSPFWLSNSLARKDFQLDVLRIDQEIVDATSILEQLTEKRDLILALLDR